MKRVLFFSGLGTVSAAFALLQACGGDSGTDVDGGTDGTISMRDNYVPPMMDGSMMNMDGSMMNMDGSMMNMDGSMMNMDGGAGSNPGKVNCGPMIVCDAGAGGCCLGLQIDGGVSYSCQMTTCVGLRWNCDEPADCPNNQQCCIQTQQGVSKLCSNVCGNNTVRACKTASDCGDGGACNTYTCPGNVQIMACSKPQNCN